MKTEMIDIIVPSYIDICVSKDNKVLWINVDGVCRLRACQVKNLTIDAFNKHFDSNKAVKKQQTKTKK